MGDKIHRNSLQPGHKLHWYRIEKILGQGGFGITYLAHDFNLDRPVAIKEYLPIELAVRERDFSVHPVTEEQGEKFRWGLDRFITEARTLARFKHPNIVHVLNVFEENNTAYMVMEYEHGESLQDILTRRKTLEEAELINILIPILGGLQKVHEAGFIHRDIKPANIFIREDGSPVLLDFGSARQALSMATQTLTSLVSPGYAPYEQYYSKSDQQGPWTDIYGLGATLYRAISGKAPMDAVDRSRAILKGDKDVFVTATQIGKGRYSERFLQAVDHALQFKEEDRPRTISAWKSEFGLPDDPIKQAIIAERTPTQPGTQVLERQQQNKWVSRKVAILVVLVGIGVLYLYHGEIQDYLFGPTKTQLEAERQRVEDEEKKLEAEKQKTESERLNAAATLPPGFVLDNEIIEKQFKDGVAAYESGNFYEALNIFMPLAKQGHAEAQFRMGGFYFEGQGVLKDTKQAAVWFQKAAEQAFAAAQLVLGSLYIHGEGVPKDPKQAAIWFQEAAKHGVAAAQNELGRMYTKGEGVPKDDKLGVLWLQKAAEQGNVRAQHSLGLMLNSGRGVARNSEQAVNWIQKSAEQGYAEAQLTLGLMHIVGENMSKDVEKGLRWIQKAADQDNEDAIKFISEYKQ